jgi:hypothetical protein
VIGDKSLPFDDVAVAAPRSTARLESVSCGRSDE